MKECLFLLSIITNPPGNTVVHLAPAIIADIVVWMSGYICNSMR